MSLSTTASSAFRSVYDLAFQVSPIILNGGIVASTLGGMMPIIGLTGQLASFAGATLTSGSISADNFFARFVPVPGGTVISNAVATFPFANQSVAANAIIEQPLAVSLLMIAPVKEDGGYLSKLATFTALRTSLRAHNAAGGTYHIATPSFIYQNCVMTGMQDVTSGEGKQQQIMWQLDFIKPLISETDALTAQNALMSKVTGGQPITPSGLAGTSIWSSAATAVGSAAQGAVQGINGIAGAVNTFLSQ
ncbi:hypothetical protein [Paraburkholderia caledonica]|uniref:Uncharacterized protein n=1 Tax=Paraburkholderia caledonica TaxID=134536 RepID=A0AB73IP08_9BURK|nr:hypothetical protein [Paraburkholderia caledonica]